MFREIAHFARQLPAMRSLQARSQSELYEIVMEEADAHGLAELRRELVAPITGHALEIGCGSGRMFPYYAASVHLAAIEPDDSFRMIAEDVAERATAHIEVAEASAEALPFEDDVFDDIVVAMVLCSVGSLSAALAEMRRVLHPDGRIHLLEHVISDRPLPAALMHLVNPAWRALNRQGCNMNRDPLPAMHAAGFTVVEERPYQLFAPYLPPFPSKLIRARPR